MNAFGYNLKIEKLPVFAKNKDEIKDKVIDKKRHELFSKTHPLRLIISLSIAPVLVIIVNAIYQLSDTFLTALLTDDSVMINGEMNSLSTIAINTSMVVWTPLWAVSMGAVQGSLAWFTKAQGAQDPKKMGQINSSAFLFITTSAFIGAIICISAGKSFLELSVSIDNAADKERIVNEAFMYIWPRLATLPFISIYLYLVRCMRTLNVRFWTIIPYTVSVCLNLLLDYLLIQFAKMGIFGSGLATAIADMVAMTLALGIFIKHIRKEPDEVKFFRPSLTVMWSIFLLGLPNILNLWLRTALLFFTVRWSSEIGAIGVSSAMRVVDSLVIYPGFGFIQGAMIALGYAYGSKNYKRLHSLVKWLFYAIFSYFLFLTFILFFISEDLLNLLQIYEPRGFIWMRLAYVALILLSFGESLRAYYSATHQKLKSFVASTISTLSPIPFLFLFGAKQKDLELYWFAYIYGDILACSLMLTPFLLLLKRSYLINRNKIPKVYHLSIQKIKAYQNENP